MRNAPLQQLRTNIEAAEDAMRRHGPDGGTPDRHWCAQQLTLVRLTEEAGTISGEWDGLFVGLLDGLITSKRHLGQLMDNVPARSPEANYDNYVRAITAWADQKTKHADRCAEFIAKFGDRLALKAEL